MLEQLKNVMIDTGAAWVLWIMAALSLGSLAVIIERGWLFWSLRDDIAALMAELTKKLDARDFAGAKTLLARSKSTEAAVVHAGLLAAERGRDAADTAMTAANAWQKAKLERWLSYLGTVGSNAPFIGLLGTVIGIMGAFEELSRSQIGGAQLAPEGVMAKIAEALVATAIGLIIAIPAVTAFNFFQRAIKTRATHTEALANVLLSHLPAGPHEG
jgi:biopolymer transport protein ExbB